MKTTLFLMAIYSSIAACSAFAGHCKYLSAKYATEAFKDLSKYSKSAYLPIVDRYCAECMDEYVKPVVIEDIEYRPHQVKGYAGIVINGKEVDLAYLYLNGKNLGHRYNCKTPVASEYLFGPKQKTPAKSGRVAGK